MTLRRLARDALDRARPLVGRRALILLLVISACGWAFARLADEMREGETHRFDVAVLLALRDPGDPADPLGPVWVAELARDVTALGGTGVLVMVTLTAAGYLWLIGRRGATALVLGASASGIAASLLLKGGFDRPRPDLVPHGAVTYTSSFPSSHAMMAAVVYLTLAVMLARVEKRRRVRIYILAVAILLTLLVGTSRVYLGVHWPTDVLAGWAAGAGWALGCLLVAGWLQRRGVLAPTPPDEPPDA
ncbi:phosphatase PAP2 family protein [Amaricoccus sp.]|uniref:phosphatase PAP2 family protein n=1 Tax=Amaricoccus sp. TaxID=1872485 RepID=UPI001B59FA27|nr:phosphatase PAP2 family protein [Amaricoccus sp.]MBP7001892.1 phosphatase PAP2 family protein [Amaricoccus sp.]